MCIPPEKGFTLLELLVVVSLLAVIAFIGSGTYKGVLEDSDERLVRAEMQEIASAIRRFKQDTGYYPGEGPFSMEAGGQITDADVLARVPHSGATATARKNWFNSPANFYLLLKGPLLPSSHQLASWSAETGRGWRGPYLAGFGDGYVNMGDNINANQAGSGGNPASGTIVPDVDGLADPFEHPRINGLLGWSRTVSPARVENDKWGRPYLYFHDADTRWLVSMGPNGEYDGLAAGSDDLELYITE